jgi:low temperature requirement protein LtrA
MPILSIAIVLIVVGFALWVVNTYIPMANSIKTILNAVVVIAVLLWLLSALGIIHNIGGIKLK